MFFPDQYLELSTEWIKKSVSLNLLSSIDSRQLRPDNQETTAITNSDTRQSTVSMNSTTDTPTTRKRQKSPPATPNNHSQHALDNRHPDNQETTANTNSDTRQSQSECNRLPTSDNLETKSRRCSYILTYMWVPNHTLHVNKPVFTRPRCFTEAIVYLLLHTGTFARIRTTPPPPPISFLHHHVMQKLAPFFFSLNGEFAFKRKIIREKSLFIRQDIRRRRGKFRSTLGQNVPWYEFRRK